MGPMTIDAEPFERMPGLRVVAARVALKRAVLEEMITMLPSHGTTSNLDESWGVIDTAARELVAAHEEWAEYVKAQRQEHIGLD